MRLVNKINKGFTLVELLVVMAILGVLVTLVASGFRTAQMRGRDAQRKSDLKQLANSLELLYSDYNEYPAAISNQIGACPFVSGAGTACAWGVSEMTDNKTVYFKEVPADPSRFQVYFYRVPDTAQQKFQLFARLENSQDADIITTPYSCGDELCNFAITSQNTNAVE